MNLIEKLGLEKCKAIVDGAQDSDGLYDLVQNKYISWEDSSIGMVFMVDRFIEISDLRTAIANHECDHDWENITCNGDLERQLICTYCSIKKSVPFELNAKQWADEDTDHCTDIRNHIGPLTGVIER